MAYMAYTAYPDVLRIQFVRRETRQKESPGPMNGPGHCKQCCYGALLRESTQMRNYLSGKLRTVRENGLT